MKTVSHGLRIRLHRYSHAYRSRLLEAGKELCKFLHKLKLEADSLYSLPTSELDGLLEQFVNLKHSQRSVSKGALRVAKHAVLFVQVLRPRTRHRLKSAWSCLKAWEETQPSQLRSPLPIGLLIGMCCQARLVATETPAEPVKNKWYIFSALLGAGFFGLLRPGELYNLKKLDVGPPNQLSFGTPCVTLKIDRPKNFRQLGHSQFVVINQPDVCNWISWAAQMTKGPKDLLWKSSPAEFRRMFKECCEQLVGKGHCFSPASLRAGGATFKFDLCPDIGRLRLEGRWSTVQSLEHYIQVAKAQQLVQSIEPAQLKKITKLISKGYFLVALPIFLARHLTPSWLLKDGLDAFDGDRPLWARCRKWGAAHEKV